MIAAAPLDQVFFAGNFPQSRLIALRTCSLRQLLSWQLISHVGTVINYAGELCIVESTTLAETPCLVTGKRVHGVQVHPLEERVRDYPGRVWICRLNYWQKISDDESARLTEMVLEKVRTPYDTLGAVFAGTEILHHLRPLDLKLAYCSELSLWLIKQFHRAPARGRSEGSNPAKLARRLVRKTEWWNDLELVKPCPRPGCLMQITKKKK